ncbi:MAG: right-handed parallel beta-helix repeat-containing protein [Phycisphaerales bacterium]|nr:right-handed parallel beta-helix repeat-containing protein [Phycisphaerales bacterium]
MNRTLASLMCLATACSAALAQFSGGVNIDLNAVSGAGSGQPTILFGGAAAQGGYWNPINPPFTSGSSQTVRNLANSANAVVCAFTLAGAGTGTFAFNNTNTTGDAELLMDDVHDLGGLSASAQYTLFSFAPGIYEVYTYAAAPDNGTYLTRIGLQWNQGAQPDQVVGGVIPAGAVFTQGVTHAKHTVALALTSSITITATTESGFGSVNGIQVKRLNPTRLYVSASSTVANQDGLSWATALQSLQQALAIAEATPSVTEIWVQRGTYNADAYPAAAGSATATFRLRSGLALYGGFNGGEATLAARPLFLFNGGTILNGAFGAGGGRVNSVVTADGVNNTAILDGFDVRNGGSAATNGGGIAVINASPIVRHCTLRDNLADSGGGASVIGTGSVLFHDCLFMQNTAGFGAAIRSTAGAGMTITMRRCAVIANSTSVGTAGTIGVWCNVVMENCLVANNDHPVWIMDLSPSPSVTMLNCTIANNRSQSGGANPHVGIALGASNTIRNSVIWGNVALGGGTPSMSGVLHGSGLTISDSIVQQWDGTLAGPAFANFSADPRFVAPAAAGNTAGALSGDYQLGSRSPARDSGWNAVVPAGPDLAGMSRIVDDPYFPNTGYAGGTVDRGCYEASFSSAICPGDIGRTGGVPGADGERNNNDFIVFIDYFFAANPLADVGRTGGVAPGDGVFDNNDFIVFIDQFFTFCP